ncbi:MAG TPA: ABC transporter substrate-binding protein [Candidatus Limnocylindria bacterium]
MPRSFARLLALLTAFSLVLAACSGGTTTTGGGATAAAGAPVAGGSLSFALENDLINGDPMLSSAFVDRNVHYLIYDTLLRSDPKGNIIAGLATKWETSSDGKTMTLTLREGVTFQDGTPFNADSVKWNLDRYRTEAKSQRKGELGSVDSVTVVDPKTVKLNLKAPFSPLAAQLVDRSGMMVSQKAVEAGGADFTRKPVNAGTGPFAFVEAVKDDHITLAKNAKYWEKDKNGVQLPYLDKITIKPITDGTVRLTQLKTGDVQASNNIPGKDVADMRKSTELTWLEAPNFGFNSIILNNAPTFVFNEVKYRQAVATAIDRQELLDKVSFGVGQVGYGPIAPAHFAYDPAFKPFTVDPAKAKSLVDSVGKGPLSFTLIIAAGDPVQVQFATLIQAQMQKAGIDMKIQSLEFAQILDQQTKHIFKDATLVGWSGRLDPDGNTYDHIVTGKPFNDASYSSKVVDDAMDQQRTLSDPAARKPLLRKAEETVVTEAGRVWYSFRITGIATAKKVHGVDAYPDGIIRFAYAWIK